MSTEGTSGGEGRRVLVAGVGNVFLGDDGFGVEVVNRMATQELPGGVEVADYGIRGVHLAYELLDGRHDTLIMVDAVPLDGMPGTLAVLEVSADGDHPETTSPDPPSDGVPIDGHGMDPQAVLRLVRRLGGRIPRTLVVGCRPAVLEEGVGLSPPVEVAAGRAVRLVTELARQESAGRGNSEGTDA